MRIRVFIFSIICLAAAIFPAFTFAGEAAESGGIELPVIMYHAVVPDRYAADAYTVKISDFISDLDCIADRGYTTVLPRDLISYVRGEKDLPEKPVMLTFDDGFCGVKDLAMPALISRGQCAAVAVVGKFMRDDDERKVLYGYLSLKECAQMHESGAIEIISHSFNLHKLKPRKGATRLWGESDDDYADFLRRDTEKLHALLENVNIRPTSYAYPFGAFDKKSNEVLREMGYALTLVCREKTNLITRDENCLLGLGRYNRSGVKKGLLEKLLV